MRSDAGAGSAVGSGSGATNKAKRHSTDTSGPPTDDTPTGVPGDDMPQVPPISHPVPPGSPGPTGPIAPGPQPPSPTTKGGATPGTPGVPPAPGTPPQTP